MEIKCSNFNETIDYNSYRTLNYNFNKATSVAFGFAFKGDREQENTDFQYTQENRIYEQFMHQFKIFRIELMLRGRLEQRWINEEESFFTQRARAFLSAQIPVWTNKEFTKGFYVAAQNEVFLNIENQDKVNESLFDQNRTFISTGYRWNKSVDTEIGYMYWHQPEMQETYNRHVIQLQVTTNF
ncbi:MAG: DUF2490 domain-containing protein [Chryseobacterium sp.]|nr:MAG: DUF2490 domain-containing protein [Chryseobacterium sp.]